MNNSWYYNTETEELGCFVQGLRAGIAFCVLDASIDYAMNRVSDRDPHSVPSGFKRIERLEFNMCAPQSKGTTTVIKTP